MKLNEVIRIEFSLNRIHGLIKQGREKPLYKPDEDTNSRHQQSKKTILTRTGPCWHSDLGLSVSTTITTNNCLLLEPAYGTFVTAAWADYSNREHMITCILSLLFLDTQTLC